MFTLSSITVFSEDLNFSDKSEVSRIAREFDEKVEEISAYA
jgi:hypothetical protein